MTATGPSGRELAMMLADDIESVVEALGLDVKSRSRRTLYCFSPWNGHHNPKLEIEIYPKAGKWNDWIEGAYGDVIDLVACVLAGGVTKGDKDNLARAFRWAREYLGVEGASFDRAAFEKRQAEAADRAAKREARARREVADQRKTALARFLAASHLTAGDPGWDYLKARGIDLALLPRLPGSVRLSRLEPWYDGESSEPSHVGPALISAMTQANGDLGSIHRIWINPDRPGEKADITPARKMWPASEGSVIRIWRGESGLAEREAAERGRIEDVIVCEGVEDGLSIALMTPELRIYAAGSLAGLDSFTPPKIARTIIVAADNDWGKPQADALLKRACSRLVTEFGKRVRIARSPVGKDFNDLIRGDD